MNKKGFTLIEILTTVAILAILSAVVLSSLNNARIRGRDLKRVADIKQIQQALENYFDACYSYPSDLSAFNGTDCKGNKLIPSVPKDPLDKTDYIYSNINATDPAQPVGFYLCSKKFEKAENVPKNKANVMKFPCGCNGGSCTDPATGSNRLIYDVVGGTY